MTGSLTLSAESAILTTIGRGAIAVLRIGADRAGTRLLLQFLAQLHREWLRATSISV